MKYCEYCGSKIDDTALFCPNCGASQSGGAKSNNRSEGGCVPPVNLDFSPAGGRRVVRDAGKRSGWVAVLAFLFWWAGLIMWLVWKDTKPGYAISAAKGALSALCVGIPIAGLVLWVLWKNDRPELAKVCGISAIVGVVVNFILSIALQALGAYIAANPDLLDEIYNEIGYVATRFFK